MSHHMTMGRQLVGRALTTRRAPRSSSHARGPLGTIVRAWVRQQQAQSVMCKAHRALHTNTSRHRRASDPCCCSRAVAPDPLLPLAVSTQLPDGPGDNDKLRPRSSSSSSWPLSGHSCASSCTGISSNTMTVVRQLQHRRVDGVLGGRHSAADHAGIPLHPTIRLTRPGRESARVLLVGPGCPARGELIVDCTK